MTFCREIGYVFNLGFINIKLLINPDILLERERERERERETQVRLISDHSYKIRRVHFSKNQKETQVILKFNNLCKKVCVHFSKSFFQKNTSMFSKDVQCFIGRQNIETKSYVQFAQMEKSFFE